MPHSLPPPQPHSNAGGIATPNAEGAGVMVVTGTGKVPHDAKASQYYLFSPSFPSSGLMPLYVGENVLGRALLSTHDTRLSHHMAVIHVPPTPNARPVFACKIGRGCWLRLRGEAKDRKVGKAEQVDLSPSGGDAVILAQGDEFRWDIIASRNPIGSRRDSAGDPPPSQALREQREAVERDHAHLSGASPQDLAQMVSTLQAAVAKHTADGRELNLKLAQWQEKARLAEKRAQEAEERANSETRRADALAERVAVLERATAAAASSTGPGNAQQEQKQQQQQQQQQQQETPSAKRRRDEQGSMTDDGSPQIFDSQELPADMGIAGAPKSPAAQTTNSALGAGILGMLQHAMEQHQRKEAQRTTTTRPTEPRLSDGPAHDVPSASAQHPPTAAPAAAAAAVDTTPVEKRAPRVPRSAFDGSVSSARTPRVSAGEMPPPPPRLPPTFSLDGYEPESQVVNWSDTQTF